MTFTFRAPESVLARVFPETTDIERATISQDAEGTVEETWSTLYTDIPSQFSTEGETEPRTPAGEFVKRESTLHLRGDWDIAEHDRAVTRGVAFDITAVHHNSYAVITTLEVEERVMDEEGSS
jgi:head-tail adaptor